MRGFENSIVMGAIGLGLVGCGMNQSGHLSATNNGDTSHPAERGSPIDELRTACGGDGALTADGGVILRHPYLQQVTTSSAMIGWVSRTPDGETVEITKPDGAPVSTLAAAVDGGALRSTGENQVWTSMSSLTPDTIYCYDVKNGSELAGRTGFRTAPTADNPKPVRFLAFGDSGGGGSDQYALLEQMYKFPYDVMIHTGDVAYDDGTISQFNNNVFGVYTDLFRNVPFFPAAGNHDYNTLQGAPFRDVFALPDQNGERWYSYDWGRVHFVALDTESDYATQTQWLDQDLAANTLPWKIIYLHRPPYSSGEHGSDTKLRSLLAPVAEKYGVQLILAGHDHDYERMAPQNGVAYIVTGGGGRGTRPVSSSSFTVLSDDVIHFVYGEVSADEMVLHAVDATGKEFDSVVIPRAAS
ncbi:MAG TPA: metallophosphoesterase [Kofleriaceae bacterium]|nr:metallophosphoesterase [Kofleriaceae bacterium]